MEYGNAQLTAGKVENDTASEFTRDSEFVSERLDLLLRTNAEIKREKLSSVSEHEKLLALAMKNPLNIEKTFANFGILLGVFPPAALFTRFFIDSRIFQSEGVWILGVAAIVILVSTVSAYISGKYISTLVSELEKMSWSKMLTLIPFVGVFWGMIAGGAGGIVVLGIGAFFGAIIGALVGGAALPLFSIFHRLLKQNDQMENKHFLPLAFGISFIISAFFLGL
jgi:hypothetical protein